MAARQEDVEDDSATSKGVPITLLQNTASNVYTHIHPILVLSTLYALFASVVNDPVASLAYLLLPLAGLQAAFAMICVPSSSVARSSLQTAGTHKSVQGQRRKQKSSGLAGAFASRVTPAVLSIFASISIVTPPVFVILVLHGAPITTHIPHTILLAAHISLLSCIPLFYTYGVDSTKWRTIYSLIAPVDELMGAAIGTLVGSWLGAIPIPLDWDREWQKWPVTVVVGAYLGWAVGRTLGATPWLKGKVVQFD